MKKINILVLIGLSCAIMSCKQGKPGFFAGMPNRFFNDSLTVQKELFANISIQHLNNNSINLETQDAELIPFSGILKVEGDTIYFRSNRSTKKEKFKPYLILSAPKFDTLRFSYTSARSDEVVAMGKMYDKISRDSLQYFQLTPTKRRAASGSTYLKYIALKKGEGIRYLTFSNYSSDYTIKLVKYPKVVWSSNY